MKILLVIPDNPLSARFQLRTAGITPPLGIAYLASYLLKAHFDVSILDNSIEHLREEDFIKKLITYKPDIVGISALTYAVPNALKLTCIIKKSNPGIKVILGGPHATALSRDMLQHESVDIVVKGEGEETLVEVCRRLSEKEDLKGLKGILYKTANGFIENGDRDMIADLDGIPFPAYQLLAMDKYFLPASRRNSNRKIGSIITKRGCPYTCNFCSKGVFGQQVRFRTPANVVEEMELLAKKYGIGEIVIWDDNFNLDQKRAIEICELMKRKKLDMVWSCNNRANLFSDEFCRAIYEAGCRQVNFGIESGVQELRDNIRKDITDKDIEKAIRLCRKYRLLVSCSFIFGLPGETWETAMETLKFAKQLNPDYVMFCGLVPMPGSELFELAIKNSLIDKEKTDWEKYVTLLSAAPPVVSLCDLSKNDLIKLQKKVFREFYFRPRYIWETLVRTKTREHIRQVFRGLNAILSYQCAKIED